MKTKSRCCSVTSVERLTRCLAQLTNWLVVFAISIFLAHPAYGAYFLAHPYSLDTGNQRQILGSNPKLLPLAKRCVCTRRTSCSPTYARIEAWRARSIVDCHRYGGEDCWVIGNLAISVRRLEVGQDWGWWMAGSRGNQACEDWKVTVLHDYNHEKCL